MKSILAGLAITLLSTSAMADDTAKGSKNFTQLDTNRDGKITRVEAAGSSELSAAFKSSDADGDGHLEARYLI